MSWTRLAPAREQASLTARRSTSVIPDGAHMTTRGRAVRLGWAVRMKWRSMASVTSKSAMTPWRSGRVAEIVAGVRPIIRLASKPTACTSPVCSLIATTDGSDSTTPWSGSYTSVFAVPRSWPCSDRRSRSVERGSPWRPARGR